ncbi:MAG TPA: glycosyltransferase family 4 protein, partial [Gemmataceae bacterium]|nr:glycosyltransferase family 4 protein [Gemmataceae bacterium]
LAASIREFQPDVITAWGLKALSAACLAAPKRQAALVVRRPIPSNRRRASLSRLETWLLRRADRVLVANDAEALRYEAMGLPSGKLRVVRPGVRLHYEQADGSGDPLCKSATAVEESAPRIVCAGALEPHKGFYEAIWTFDILHFADRETELTIAGEGSERRRLEEFAARADLRERIHFTGKFTTIEPLLAQAALAWVPSLSDSGTGVALEAMAAGLPVIAARWPGLADIIVDGETGFLVHPGSKIELAQKTRLLLDDSALRRRLGEAGQRRAEELFTHHAFIEAWLHACSERRAA